ncbi:hypothetical protein [Paenibacillus assamensis]|uniref:hypothetical protein n=1 Tax=Paenibacillus assamensis TaxID=311244 RepID=UPI000427E130|nr:hypothetical protein [Paenibacillus assamensis]
MRTVQKTGLFIVFLLLYYVICSVIGFSYMATTKYQGRISLEHFDDMKVWVWFIFPVISLSLSFGTLLLMYRPWKKKEEKIVD